MLYEYKLIYEECANICVPDWKSMDKNAMIKRASELQNGPERDSYVAAIMLRYWNKLGRFYSKCKLVATQEDVHMWLTMAVLYALDNKPWENPKSSIYGDKNGPDKVINRVMECRRITFYQQLNRYNRKINSGILSLDSLTEDLKDVVMPMCEDATIIEVFDLVTSKFNQGEYMMAFVLDAIICSGLRNCEEDYRKFVTYLRKMNESFCVDFSNRYDVPVEDVKSAADKINLMNNVDMRKRVEYNLIRLKNFMKE